MKIGKYRYLKNGSIKVKKYIVRKRIPSYKRRVIMFGPSGYGKNSVLIADAMKKNENVLYISVLSAETEFSHMPAVSDKIIVCTHHSEISADFNGRISYCLGNVPTIKKEEIFINEVVPYLESSGIVKRSDVTIILDNLVFLTRHSGYLDEMTNGWRCKVVVDLTCGVGACDIDFVSRKWWKLPVFAPLF